MIQLLAKNLINRNILTQLKAATRPFRPTVLFSSLDLPDCGAAEHVTTFSGKLLTTAKQAPMFETGTFGSADGSTVPRLDTWGRAGPGGSARCRDGIVQTRHARAHRASAATLWPLRTRDTPHSTWARTASNSRIHSPMLPMERSVSRPAIENETPSPRCGVVAVAQSTLRLLHACPAAVLQPASRHGQHWTIRRMCPGQPIRNSATQSEAPGCARRTHPKTAGMDRTVCFP